MVREGFLAAARGLGTNSSRFSPADDFKPRRAVEPALLDELDACLRQLGPAWGLCLEDQDDLAAWRAGTLTNVETTTVARLTADWTEASRLLREWGSAQTGLRFRDLSLAGAYRRHVALVKEPQSLQPRFAGLLESTPLLWQPTDLSQLTPMQRRELSPDLRGTIRFSVLRFTREDLGPDRFVFGANAAVSVRAGARPRTLARLLAHLEGQLWSPRRIRRELGDFYERMGFVVAAEPGAPKPGTDASLAVEILPLKAPTRQVLIHGSPQLSGFWIACPLDDARSLDRVLYQLLSTDDFNRVRAERSRFLAPITWRRDPTNPTVQLDFSRLALTNPAASVLRAWPTFVNHTRLQDQLRRLNGIGWSAVLTNAVQVGSNKFAELFVAPITGLAWRTNAPPEPGSDPAPPARGSPEAAAPGEAAAAGTETQSPPLENAARAAEKLTADKRNHLRLEVEYSPRQPVSLGVSYSRLPLSAHDSATATVGWQEEAFGEFAYARDFLGFDALGRRLGVSVSGGSSFEADRLVGDLLVNERRSGGEVSAQIELFRDLGGRWLALDLGGGARVVEHRRDSQLLDRYTLANLDLGLRYVILRDGTRSSRVFELLPALRVAHSDDAGWHVKPRLQATYHQLLPPWPFDLAHFAEWDAAAGIAWASAGTPAAELPSFGGEESVRGYRQDAALGRTAWAVRNELWFPLRFGRSFGEPIDRLLRRHLYLAPFLDFGGAHDTVDGFSGVKAGAGVGLRYRHQTAILRLDWAHALKDAPSDRGGSMFYFTISIRPGL